MITQTPQTRALSWIKAGFFVTPIPCKSKAPLIKDWQKLRVTESTIGEYFNGDDQNMGLLLGAPSKWTIDFDLDSAETIETAGIFFPETFGFGRKSRPKSHLLYKCEGAKTKKFSYGGQC